MKNPDNLKYIFDLKGSTVDRKVKGVLKPSTTLKDMNFLIAAQTPGFINLGETRRKHLLDVVKKDVDFLSSRGFMDYSLLLAVEVLDEADQEKYESRKDQNLIQDESKDAGKVRDVGELMSQKHSFI